MMAAGAGHTGIVELLLDAGANPDTENAYGFTALRVAWTNGRTEVVELLTHWSAP